MTEAETDVQDARNLATLIVRQAKDVMDTGVTVQLLWKVQIPENKGEVCNFQGWRDMANECHSCIENIMMTKLPI